MTVLYETRKCILCNEASFIMLDDTKCLRWQGGERVQVVWPEMPPDERELLITGTHPQCWDEMFKKGQT